MGSVALAEFGVGDEWVEHELGVRDEERSEEAFGICGCRHVEIREVSYFTVFGMGDEKKGVLSGLVLEEIIILASVVYTDTAKLLFRHEVSRTLLTSKLKLWPKASASSYVKGCRVLLI